MSPDTDHVPVPTNGKGPHPIHAPIHDPVQDDLEPAEMTVAFTPAQLAVGFGILASLVLLLVRRLRRRWRSGSRGPFARR